MVSKHSGLLPFDGALPKAQGWDYDFLKDGQAFRFPNCFYGIRQLSSFEALGE